MATARSGSSVRHASPARLSAVRGQPSNGEPSGIAMSQSRRAWDPQGYSANVAGSGWRIMSSSSPRTNPSIDPPSKVTFPSRAASSSLSGIETFLLTPSTSAKAKRTNRTSRSFAIRSTSRLPVAFLVCECINRHRHSQGELVVRIGELAGANFADLPQSVEHGVPVHAELLCRRLDVLADGEVQAQRALEFGLVLFIVRAQRRERTRREVAQRFCIRTRQQQGVCAEFVVHADAAGTVEAARNR